MRSLAWIIVAAPATLGICALLVGAQLPLGIEGQWEWGWIDSPTWWYEYLSVAFFVILYVAFVARGVRWATGSVGARRASLLGLVLGGFFVQMSVQQVGYGMPKWPFVLFSESSSGYYTAAKRDVKSAADFLASYDRIQVEYERRYGPLHLATHPPGLILLHYGALQLCHGSPGFKRFLLALQPESVRNGFLDIAGGAQIPIPDRASIWLVALLSQLASALTVLPIYSMARRCSGPAAAWCTAAFWPLVPAVTVFMPKSDVLYPLFAASCVALAVGGRTTAGRWACGVASGVVLCMGMFLTFGLVAVFPLTALAIAVSEGMPSESTMRSTAQRGAGFIVGFLSTQFFWMLMGLNLPLTWWRCFRVHATFYEPGQIGTNRTYWPWVGWNLAEFAVAAGIPLMVAAVAGTAWLLRRTPVAASRRAVEPAASGETARCNVTTLGVVAGWWLTVLALDLSGKNLGEVARLWMFLIPFACVAASEAIERLGAMRWAVILLLVLQAIQTVVFAANVQGFYDPASVKVPRRVEGQGSRFERQKQGRTTEPSTLLALRVRPSARDPVHGLFASAYSGVSSISSIHISPTFAPTMRKSRAMVVVSSRV
jgi:hypothetical protein